MGQVGLFMPSRNGLFEGLQHTMTYFIRAVQGSCKELFLGCYYYYYLYILQIIIIVKILLLLITFFIFCRNKLSERSSAIASQCPRVAYISTSERTSQYNVLRNTDALGRKVVLYTYMA